MAENTDEHARPTTAVVDLDDSTFAEGTEGAWTAVDFWALWCGPCRAFLPVFEEVAALTSHAVLARCNVEENPESARALGIQTIPTVVLFDPDGNEVDRISGVLKRADLDLLLTRVPQDSGVEA